ncbi:MAG: hypothetical protein IJS73_01415 [Paludibacteraceae bacterium]|nr:hypothetical protein [Paludibacteraceae bacterium]
MKGERFFGISIYRHIDISKSQKPKPQANRKQGACAPDHRRRDASVPAQRQQSTSEPLALQTSGQLALP